MEIKFLFLLICYYNEDEVSDFIRNQLSHQTLTDFQVVVVDNGCHHKGRLNEWNDQKKYFVYSPGENLGYFGGAAYALKKHREVFPGLADFVIISNTDIILEPTVFLKLMHDKYFSGKVDVIGPDVISTLNGQHQNPYIPERISRKKMEFFRDISSNSLKYNTFLLAYYAKNKLTGLLQKAARSYEKGGEVYSIHGSFMVFSKHFFEKGGHFTYGSFLFGEEIFIGEIARLNDLRVVYDPAFRIIHREHATTGIFKKARNVKFMHDSYCYILKTYY